MNKLYDFIVKVRDHLKRINKKGENYGKEKRNKKLTK